MDQQFRLSPFEKAADLKKGFRVRVTTKADDATIATKIEAFDKNADFHSRGRCPHELRPNAYSPAHSASFFSELVLAKCLS